MLAVANLALASAMFAEPILFGRIVDTLANAQGRLAAAELARPDDRWSAPGSAFGLFTIVCGTLVALHADRLAHRQRQVVLTDYFEHVLQLPLSYHSGTHSGRLMKVMLTGTNTLWGLWLVVLPRALRRLRLAARAAAAVAVPQLALGAAADRAVRRVHGC